LRDRRSTDRRRARPVASLASRAVGRVATEHLVRVRVGRRSSGRPATRSIFRRRRISKSPARTLGKTPSPEFPLPCHSTPRRKWRQSAMP